MKILLDSNTNSIFNIVNLCCERVNIELITLNDETQEYDFTIKDCSFDTDIDTYNTQKTLFLIPRYLIDDFKDKLYLAKPFLPIDLIKILKQILPNENIDIDDDIDLTEEIENENIENEEKDEFENIEFIENNAFSENIGKTKQDLMHEIEDLQIHIKENINKQDEFTQKILNEIYESDSDIPLDKLIEKYQKIVENTNLKNYENLQNVNNSDNLSQDNFEFQANKMLNLLKMANFTETQNITKEVEENFVDNFEGALDLSNTITVFAPIDKDRVKATLVKIIKKHLVNEIENDTHLKEAMKKLKLDINISLKER